MTESGDTRSSIDRLAPDDTAESTALSWRSRRLKPVWFLAAAGIFFLALWGWTELRLQASRAELEESTASHTALEETVRRLRLENQKLAENMHTFTAAESRAFALGSTNRSAADANGRAFVDPSGRGLVYLFNLPPQENYHLWAVRSGSPGPQRVAIFGVDSSGTAQISRGNFPTAAECRSLFVTRERMPAGSPRGPRYLASR